jgi:hypothetical protein
MNHLSEALHVDQGKRHVRCIGHIINLVAHKVLFGQGVESFEKELENITAESVKLASWRKRGPIGKLHNLIKYICYSTQRRDAFKKIQEDAAAPLQTKHRRSYDLIHDNLTR